MIPPSIPNILAQLVGQELARAAPHILHFGFHKGVEAWDKLEDKLEERRKAPQVPPSRELSEKEMKAVEELAFHKLAVDKLAVKDLRRREPHLTKEQATRRVFLDSLFDQ